MNINCVYENIKCPLCLGHLSSLDYIYYFQCNNCKINNNPMPSDIFIETNGKEVLFVSLIMPHNEEIYAIQYENDKIHIVHFIFENKIYYRTELMVALDQPSEIDWFNLKDNSEKILIKSFNLISFT